jgi:hypothetical protein
MPENERKVVLKIELKPGDASAIRSAFDPIAKDLSKTFSGFIGQAFVGAGGQDTMAKIKQGVASIDYGSILGQVNRLFGGKLGPLGVGGLGALGMQMGGVIGGPAGGAVSGMGQLAVKGAAGFAVGGPMGALAAVVPELLDNLVKKLMAGVRFATAGFEAMTSSIRELGGQLGAGGVVLSAMKAITSAIPFVGKYFAAFFESLSQFLNSAVSMAKLYSPGTQTRFELAQTDTLATIGRTFTPVLEFLTDFTRLMGDFLKAVLPSAEEMRAIMSPLTTVLRDFRQSLSDLAPVLKEMGTFVIRSFVNQLTLLFRWLDNLIHNVNKLLSTLGLGGGGGELPSSTGMAARSISFGRDSTQAALDVYQAAYQNLGAKGEDPATRSASLLQDIAANVQTIRDFLPQLAVGAANTAAGIVSGTGPLDLLSQAARQIIQHAR